MASLEYETSHLAGSLQALRQQWRNAQSVWNDPVSRSFERDHIAPLEQQTTAILSELNSLAEVIAQAKRMAP